MQDAYNDIQKIKPRVRLIIIKNGKILMSYVSDEKFYFFIGGKMEFGETLKQTCEREVMEECKAKFTFKKILYVRDYIKPEQNEHSLELYILGDLDKFDEVEGFPDEEKNGINYQTWLDLEKLDSYNIKPKGVIKTLLEDYKKGFKGGAQYIGEID
jgi:ADP-ribose pyrophosphatase YjhB (NUDIX family)